jgi:hypothetical protein
MENNDIFVGWIIAKELRDLGFDEPCFGYHQLTHDPLSDRIECELILGANPEYLTCQKQMNYIFGLMTLLAPTWEQAFKFFRDKYRLFGHAEPVYIEKVKSVIKFDFTILGVDIEDEDYGNLPYHTYNEARLMCISKLIEITK